MGLSFDEIRARFCFNPKLFIFGERGESIIEEVKVYKVDQERTRIPPYKYDLLPIIFQVIPESFLITEISSDSLFFLSFDGKDKIQLHIDFFEEYWGQLLPGGYTIGKSFLIYSHLCSNERFLKKRVLEEKYLNKFELLDFSGDKI